MDPTPNPVNPPHPDHPPTDPGHLPPEPLVPVPVPRNDVSAWLKVNGWKLAVMVAIAAVVCWKFYWQDVLLAALGLSGIIFLHELGHFLAAKFCNVYVRTFSIGFGPAWPFCQFKVGETNYKLGMIPLGGYVAMAGEPTGETDPDAAKDDVDDDTDPRSFKNRPVWQRMIIISAGVVMNVILAAVCFVIAYSAGVKEMPPVVQAVEPGSAAWQAGVQPGTRVEKINDIDKPWFADIPPEVSSSSKGSKIHLETTLRDQAKTYDIEAQVAEGAYYPTLGLGFPFSTQLSYTKRDPLPPYVPNTPAHKANEAAEKAGKPTLLPGDTIVAMTDPADPTKVTPLDENWNGLPGKTFDYRRRLSALAGKEVTFEVQRLDSAEMATVTIPAAFRHDTGLRMKMGQIAAVRIGSSAEKAGFNLQQMDGEKVLSEGDVITKVTAGGVTLFDPADPKANNPLRLPFEMNQWAARTPHAKTVSVTVQQAGGKGEKTVELAWDDSRREDGFNLLSPNTPLPLGGLGLAYRVSNEIAYVVPGSPAMPQPDPPAEDTVTPGTALLGSAVGEAFGQAITAERTRRWRTKYLQAGDKITDAKIDTAVYKLNGKQAAPEPKSGSWDKVKEHHWAYVDYKLQVQPPHAIEFKADRNGVPVEGTIAATPDPTWGIPWNGLEFMLEKHTQQANGLVDALGLGGRRTVRSIKTNYQGMYGMAIGRISPFTMSGPISLATMSYKLAGEDVPTLVLFLGLISVSLAVVNFLPIPVLDGGHMMFLLYEAIFRKPPPTFIHTWLTIIGLVMVLSLMVFTIGLDIWKHFIKG